MAGLSWSDGIVDDEGLTDSIKSIDGIDGMVSIDGIDISKAAGMFQRARRSGGLGIGAGPIRGHDRRSLVAAGSVALVLLLVSTSLFLILARNGQDARIRIDGRFDDWEGTRLVADPMGDVPSSGLDLTRMGVVSDGLYLSLYLETVAPLFAGERGRTARMLIDIDLDGASGYSVPGLGMPGLNISGLGIPSHSISGLSDGARGLGADYLVELYGRQGFVLTAVLYTFEQGSRSQLDWNGFTALTAISARAGKVDDAGQPDTMGVPGGMGGSAVETQVPLFDLGLEADDELTVLFQTSDDKGNSDLSDRVLSNMGPPVEWREGPLEPAKPPAPVASNSSGITIDGYFDDWNNISRSYDRVGDVEDPDVDLLETAMTTYPDVEVERSYFYLKVAGEALHGSVIPVTSARSRPGGGSDSVGPPIPQVGQDRIPLPVVTGEEAIRLFIDVDFNASTGYSLQEEVATNAGWSLGAEQMVVVKGINGHITQRTLHQWQGSDPADWVWSKGGTIEAAASGGEVELAVKGLGIKEQAGLRGEDQQAGQNGEDRQAEADQESSEAGKAPGSAIGPSYMVHITSWDGSEDRSDSLAFNNTSGAEAQAIEDEPAGDDNTAQNVTHPVEGGGSRSSVSWPDTWTLIHTDADDGLAGDIEILGLSYAWDSDHWFFRVTTEADVDLADSTFGVFIDDVSLDDGTNVYDAAIAKYEATNDVTSDALLYHWDATGDDWDRDTIQGSDHLRANEGAHHGVDLAFDRDDLDFTLDVANDRVRAASIDSSHGDADEALETGQEWEGRNDPDYVYNDDVSGPTAIPEFASLAMPVVGVLLLATRRRQRRMRC